MVSAGIVLSPSCRFASAAAAVLAVSTRSSTAIRMAPFLVGTGLTEKSSAVGGRAKSQPRYLVRIGKEGDNRGVNS